MEKSLYLLLTLLSVAVADFPNVTINTEYGRIRGNVVYVHTANRTVHSYHAVPFGKPAVGNLRFARTEEAESWTGVRDCTGPGSVCPQGGTGSEDCLHANIVTPADDEGGPFPVMVWWHGGAYRNGGNNGYSGHWLAAKGTVAVIANYRLGCIGWVNANDGVTKGNWGLWDQRQVLLYVQRTIHSFRGDPSRVTIFGQSAGASSAGLHLLSPHTVGLFHRVIMISGTDMATWAHNPSWLPPENYTKEVARAVDCPDSPPDEMIRCMRGKNHEDLSEIGETPISGYISQGFAPVVDGEGGFLPEDPYLLRQKGLFHKNVSIMAGHTEGDGSFYLLPFVPEAAFETWNSTTHYYYLRQRCVEWVIQRESDYCKEYIARGLQWYFTHWPYEEDGDKNRLQLRQAVEDVGFGAPLAFTLKNHTQHNVTYQYFNGWKGMPHRFLYEVVGSDWWGVPHGIGDLPFIWGFPKLDADEEVAEDSGLELAALIPWDEADEQFCDFIQTVFANFAKYGDPTPTPLRAPGNKPTVKWEEYNLNKLNYIYMENQAIEVRENLFQKNKAFWEHYLLWIVENRNPGRNGGSSTTLEWKPDFSQMEKFAKKFYKIALRDKFKPGMEAELEKLFKSGHLFY